MRRTRRPVGRMARAAADPVFARLADAFPMTGRARQPSVAVYIGEGASHSWMWFADLLERLTIYDVEFAGSSLIASGGLDPFDVIMVGGGDTYAMARSLGENGAQAVEEYVRGGGLYYGSCAGAYLVLSHVDLPPFGEFRLFAGDMLNVMPDPPVPLCLEHKYLAPYGCEWVFHPVYGEVELEARDASSDFICFEGGARIGSALYGGPVMVADDDSEVLAAYTGRAPSAAHLWGPEHAAEFMAGRAAVCRTHLGDGTVLVSGPHLEHPFFPLSNALAAQVLFEHLDAGLVKRHRRGRPRWEPGGAACRGAVLDLRRELSNSRIVAFGLEKMPVTWKIGVKVWEPEKIRMFLECAWSRLAFIEDRAELCPADGLERLASGYAGVTGRVRSIRMMVESGEESLDEARILLDTLKELTAEFLTLYFELRLDEAPGGDIG